MALVPSVCACGCGREFVQPSIGRRRRYWSDGCRQRAVRGRDKQQLAILVYDRLMEASERLALSSLAAADRPALVSMLEALRDGS